MRVNSLLGISLKTLKTWELSAPATEFFFLLHQQVVGLCSKVMYLLHLLCDCNQPRDPRVVKSSLYVISISRENYFVISRKQALLRRDIQPVIERWFPLIAYQRSGVPCQRALMVS